MSVILVIVWPRRGKQISQNFFHREDQPAAGTILISGQICFNSYIQFSEITSFLNTFFLDNTYDKIYMTPLATIHYTAYCIAPPCLKELLQLWCKCFNNSGYKTLKRQLEATFLLFANKTAFIYKDIKCSTLKCIKELLNDHNNKNLICSVHLVFLAVSYSQQVWIVSFWSQALSGQWAIISWCQ